MDFWTQVKPGPGLNKIVNGESSYRSHFNSDLGLISFWETTPLCQGQVKLESLYRHDRPKSVVKQNLYFNNVEE